jgi:hypothetical protein
MSRREMARFATLMPLRASHSCRHCVMLQSSMFSAPVMGSWSAARATCTCRSRHLRQLGSRPRMSRICWTRHRMREQTHDCPVRWTSPPSWTVSTLGCPAVGERTPFKVAAGGRKRGGQPASRGGGWLLRYSDVTHVRRRTAIVYHLNHSLLVGVRMLRCFPHFFERCATLTFSGSFRELCRARCTAARKNKGTLWEKGPATRPRRRLIHK